MYIRYKQPITGGSLHDSLRHCFNASKRAKRSLDYILQESLNFSILNFLKNLKK